MAISSPVVLGIQCRLSSSRLPCKALLELAGTTVLGMCIERSRTTNYPVFLLTSDHYEDDILVESALRYGIDGVIRGSLENVLSRYIQLAHQCSCDYMLRVTADNPLTEYSFVDPLIDHLVKYSLPYAWVEPSLCPEGTNIEVFTREALFESAFMDTSSDNLEHVTSYLSRLKSDYKCLLEVPSFYNNLDCRDISFTIDTLPDYVRVAKIIATVENKLGTSWKNPDFVRLCADFAHSESRLYATGRNHPLPVD